MNLKWIKFNTNNYSLYLDNKKVLELTQHPNYNGVYQIKHKNGYISSSPYRIGEAKHYAVQYALANA